MTGIENEVIGTRTTGIERGTIGTIDIIEVGMMMSDGTEIVTGETKETVMTDEGMIDVMKDLLAGRAEQEVEEDMTMLNSHPLQGAALHPEKTLVALLKIDVVAVDPRKPPVLQIEEVRLQREAFLSVKENAERLDGMSMLPVMSSTLLFKQK